MTQKSQTYSNYHQLESDAIRNKSLEQSYQDIQDKIRNLQNEIHQGNHPYQGVDFYHHQKGEQDFGPIESDLHTYVKTLKGVHNENDFRKETRPGPKFGNQVSNGSIGDSEEGLRKSSAFSEKRSVANRETASFKNQKPNLEELKAKLRKVFQFYTTFGDRCNASNLKSNKFHKMMIDANVRDNPLTQKQLDLLFVAENKHRPNMDFDKFLQLLIKIAVQRYENKYSSKEALQKLLQEHMLPLYNEIYNKDSGIEVLGLKEPIRENVLILLKSVHVLLLKIYNVYFPWEIRTCQEPHIARQRTELALFTFLKEFDVCPSIITKSSTFTIWTEVMETQVSKLSRNSLIENMVPFLEKDVGIAFTFSRFCTLLVRIAAIAYEEHLRELGREFSQAEKLALLFERMDLSPGMNTFEIKTSITHNYKTSLLIPKNILELALSRDQVSQHDQDGLFNDTNGSWTSGKQNNAIAMTSQYSKSYKNIMGVTSGHKEKGGLESARTRAFANSEVAALFENYNESLLRIFQYYCSYGEPMNTTKLKSIKFNRMLKESGLLMEGPRMDQPLFSESRERESIKLSQIEVDIIFVKLTGSKQKDLHEKDLNFDPNIRSPYLGNINHLGKANVHQNNMMGKLSYDAFLKALELIAQKALPEFDIVQAVQYVLERHILELDASISELQTEQRYMGGSSLAILVDLLKDSEMVSFLSLVHKSMIVYFNYYADYRGLLNFEKFILFCKHFSIFPDIIPKARLKSFFQTLAAIHAQSDGEPQSATSMGSTLQRTMNQSRVGNEKKFGEQVEEDVIDQHLFVEGLALCAFDIPYNDPQPSNLEKLCYFLERLNQSDGSQIVQKSMGVTRNPGASWDILYFIRQKYPNIFIPKEQLNPPQTTNFDDLLTLSTWDARENMSENV